MRTWSSLLVAGFASLAACESGTTTRLDVELSAAADAAGAPAAPALLATDVTGGPRALAPLCGDGARRTSFEWDVDFACAGRGADADVVVRAWVEQLPDGLDAARFCALAVRDDGVVLDDALVDGGTAPLPSRERALFEGSADATWRRDLSPCGGVLEASVLVE